VSLKVGGTSEKLAPASAATPARRATPVTGDTLKVSKVLVAKNPPPLEAGFILDRRYEIEACVGEGGSGFVFRAFDKVLGQRLALKVLHAELASDKSWIKRLKREVRVAREIQHQNVCRVFDLGRADGHWFITMEYAAGGSLRQVLDARSMILQVPNKIWASAFAARFADAQAVCAGLAAIHSVGIVHRDVTPGNVLRMADDRLVITDFGLAIRTKDTTTFHGGTPKYMAPEVLERKPADQRSDVWQLGYLLHEIIFQRHPEWTHDGDRVLLKSPAHELSSDVERAIAELCTECLSHNPDARPKDAIEVAGRVAAAPHARPSPALVRLWRSVRRAARRPAFRRAVLASVILASIVSSAKALLRPAPVDPLLTRAAAIWASDEEGKAKSRFLMVLHSRPDANVTFRLVTSSIRQHLASWNNAYAAARAAVPVRPATIGCLTDDLDGVAELAALLQSQDSEGLVDGAPYAVAALRDPHRCRNASSNSTTPRPPSGSPLSVDVEQLRRALLFANPLIEGEHFAISPSIVEPLVDAAQKTGYCPVIAEALLAQAHAIGRTWAPPASYRSLLENALWQAEGCGHDRIVAIAAGELVFADRFKPDAVSSSWARMADSVLNRIGGDPSIQSWLENNRAVAAKSRGRYAEAVVGFEKARYLKRADVGTDHLEYALRLLNLSDALKGAGRLADALRTSDQGLSVMQKWLGPNHVDVGMANANRGDLLMALNRIDEAAGAYTDALAIFHATLPATDPRIAYPLAGLGRAVLQRGEHHRARDLLQQATAFDLHGDDLFDADIKFALARALVADGADSRQALSLAHAAASLLAANEHSTARRKEITDWITNEGGGVRDAPTHTARRPARD